MALRSGCQPSVSPTTRRRSGRETTIAFPSISTGAFGYPIEGVARIAIETVREVLASSRAPLEVTFCCFSPLDLAIYDALVRG